MKYLKIASACVCCLSKSVEKAPAVLMPFIAERIFGWKPVKIDEGWGLKDIKKGNAYSLCNTLSCKRCGHLFLDLRFSDSDMAKLYENYRGPSYVAQREKYEKGYARKNLDLLHPIDYLKDIEAFINKYVKNKKFLLDWGGGDGANTPFKNKVKKLHIFDISRSNFDSTYVSFKELSENKYDLILCRNVLEHIPWPIPFLKKISSIMNDKNFLYLDLPLEDLMVKSRMDKSFFKKKRHWHEHINFFSKESLEQTIKRSGLKIIAYQEYEYSPSKYIYQVICKKR
jgi:SAM-dependent methyltransferase